MPFQTSVNANPAPGLEGGWASANPHFSRLTPGNGDPTLSTYSAWVAGPNGVTVGRFTFANTATGVCTSAHPGVSTTIVCALHRYYPVIITTWLGQSSMVLTSGLEVDPMESADLWYRFAAGATVGQKVFASYADGSAIAGTAGSPPTATGVTVTTSNGSPNLTAVTGGTLLPGQPVSGTGIPAGAFIVSATGTTAVLSANATASGTGVALTQTTAIETRWFVDSPAAAGDIAKISTRG